jgi:Flp pilus assembly protein TadG
MIGKPKAEQTRTHSQRASRTRHPEKGQSLVEAAIILPILLLLLAIVVDAARAFEAYIVLTNAAREGARYASLEPSPSFPEIRTLVQDDVVGSGTNITHMGGFDVGNVDVFTTTQVVTVTVNYDFPLWFGGILGIDTFHLSKSAVMPRGEW